VVRIQRVRLADGMPLSFDETYLPKELGEKVMADNLETEPIFTLLERKYSTPLAEAEYQLEAVCADATVGTALCIGVGSAIFLIERTSYSIGHRPVDYEKLHYRGDQIRFVTRLARRTPVLRVGPAHEAPYPARRSLRAQRAGSDSKRAEPAARSGVLDDGLCLRATDLGSKGSENQRH